MLQLGAAPIDIHFRRRTIHPQIEEDLVANGFIVVRVTNRNPSDTNFRPPPNIHELEVFLTVNPFTLVLDPPLLRHLSRVSDVLAQSKPDYLRVEPKIPPYSPPPLLLRRIIAQFQLVSPLVTFTLPHLGPVAHITTDIFSVSWSSDETEQELSRLQPLDIANRVTVEARIGRVALDTIAARSSEKIERATVVRVN